LALALSEDGIQETQEAAYDGAEQHADDPCKGEGAQPMADQH
jgi:hypothetical protein